MKNCKRSVITLGTVAALGSAWADDTVLPSVTVQAVRDSDRLSLTGQSGSASRLGLTLRETPASVEVISQDAMQLRGARTLTEALRGASGLAGGGSPASPTTLSSRGFSSILYLYDGIRTSGAGVTNRVQDTWNYQRIEVLKGPASVLFGDSAIGGIVNFETKQPDRDNPGIEAMAAYGSHGSYRVGFGAGGAVGEQGAYRLDYSRNHTAVGSIDRHRETLDHLTAGLKFDLTTATRVAVSVDHSRDSGHAYWGTPLVPGSFATRPTTVVSTPDGRVVDAGIARYNYNVLDDRNEADATWLRARLTSEISPSWTLRNDFAVNKAKRLWRNSESAVFAAPDRIVRDQTTIAHDQRYAFNRVDASHRATVGQVENKVVVGGEMGDTRFDNTRRFSNGSPATSDLLQVPAMDPSTGFYNDDPALTGGAGNRVDMTADVRSRSVFVEDAIKLGSLTLVTGWRHDWTKVERSARDLNAGTFSAFGTKFRSNSGRLGLVYAVDARTSTYAQYTNAAIPVGSLFLLSAANSSFPQSKGKQVEVGIKQSHDRFEWTAAAYRITLDNVLSRDQNNANLTVNNGAQSSRGIELSAAWRATSAFTISGNLAALDARFDSLVEAGGASRVGNVPPNVPEQVANLFAHYRFAGLPLDALLSINRTGAMYTDTANQIRMNGHTTADVAANYGAGAALWTLRVRNLTDELYAYYGGRAVSQVLLAPGRTFEVSARFDF